MPAAYREFTPPESLSAHVECFWTGSGAGENSLVLPDGCVDLVFWPDGGLRAVGTMTVAQSIALPSDTRLVGARFRPGAAGAILGCSPAELTDQSVGVADLWGARGRRIEERILNRGKTLPALMELVQQQHLREARLLPALRAIEESGGSADLDAVSREANLSPRQFRRRCLEETGVTPKQLCRILRFRRVVKRLHPLRRPDWADLAVELGYYDQAHMIRDFREFSGLSPERYMTVLSNTES